MIQATHILDRFALEYAEPILPFVREMLEPFFRGGRGGEAIAVPQAPRTKPPAAAAAQLELEPA